MKNFAQIIDLLFASTHYYIICTGMDGNYSYINGNYANRFRHVDSNFVGKPFHITMHPDDVAFVTAAGTQCLMDKDALVPAQIRKLDGRGGYIITQWEFRGMFDDDGSPMGVFCLGYDITEFIAQLAKKDSILEDIAFSQSHVVRKPVANILGAVDLLKDENLPDAANELLNVLYQNTTELDEVIRKIARDARPE